MVLYNDIIPMSEMRSEHRRLREVLATVAEVHEVRDLLLRALRPQVLAVGISERTRSGGGGVRCMTLPVARDPL